MLREFLAGGFALCALAFAAGTAAGEEPRLSVDTMSSATLDVTAAGQSPAGSPKGGAVAFKGCTHLGQPIPCRFQGGYWNGDAGCYLSPSTDPGAVVTDKGRTMRCTIVGPVVGFIDVWVSNGTPAAAGPPVEALVERAVEQMTLRAVDIGIAPTPLDTNPESMGIVGRPAWLWVDEPDQHTWGPITRTATAGSSSVTATAKVQKVVWSMGNGDKVTCRTAGTPWAQWKANANPRSPSCGYTYEREGHYTVTATTHWMVEWSGMGRSGTIPFALESSVPIAVGEVQVVIVSSTTKR